MSSSADWAGPEYLDRLLADVASFPLDDLLAEVASWEPLEPEPYQPLDVPPYEPIDREPYQPLDREPYQPIEVEPYEFDVTPLPDLDTSWEPLPGGPPRETPGETGEE